MREEQWKYKRPRAAINRFPPRSLSLGRTESEEEAVFSPLGVPDYRISYRVDRFFLIPRGFEIALIHAYNIPLSLHYRTFVRQHPNFLLKEQIFLKILLNNSAQRDVNTLRHL